MGLLPQPFTRVQSSSLFAVRMEELGVAGKPLLPQNEPADDIQNEKDLFIETKAGVKGLVDSGVTKIPRFFVHTLSDTNGVSLQLPIINLEGFQSDRRWEIVNGIRRASETWGLFYMVNHGVPIHLMEKLLACVRQFHEQPKEIKRELYSHDSSLPVSYYSRITCWSDSISCNFEDSIVDSEALPLVFRKSVGEYVKCMVKVKNQLSQLLSEALGLNSDHLAHMECLDSIRLTCNYYPACPEPDLTLGILNHSDPSFLTILLQDDMGGLQILHQNLWVNVPPMPGALLANFGDLMQIITNDKFRSVEHRVLARLVGPRISAACFFRPSRNNKFKQYGPIKELLSDDDPPLYRQTNMSEFFAYYLSKFGEGISALPHFRQ